MSRPAKAGATDEVRPPRRRLCARPVQHAEGWLLSFTLASGSDPRHESRVALLADETGELSHDALDALGQPTDDVAGRLDPIDQAGGLACQEGHGRDVARRIGRRRHRPESPYRDALAGERRFADHRLIVLLPAAEPLRDERRPERTVGR